MNDEPDGPAFEEALRTLGLWHTAGRGRTGDFQLDDTPGQQQ